MIPIDKLCTIFDRHRQTIAKILKEHNIPTRLTKTPHNRNTVAIDEKHLPILAEILAHTRKYATQPKRKRKFSAAVISEYRNVMPVRRMI